MDVLTTLAYLLPAPQFGGSLTDNTQAAYEAIRWEDERTKPTWEQLTAVVIPKPVAQQLDDIFTSQPIALQIAFSAEMALVQKYAALGDWEKIVEIINTTPIPAELAATADPVKTQMLAVLNGL